jgi:hypothetical protein
MNATNLSERAVFFEAEAGVRYWEDATVDNIEDVDGTLIPFRKDDAWCPTIDLQTGKVLNWPEGTAASVHYKVCDDGLYWLLDRDFVRIARYRSDYVPGAFLCHGGNGYGDYIIMDIGPDGRIADYERPEIVRDEWAPVTE